MIAVDAVLRILAGIDVTDGHAVGPTSEVPVDAGVEEGSRGPGERLSLADSEWTGAVGRLQLALEETRARCAPDDLFSALATLWTVRRIRDGAARALHDDPPTDAVVLRIAIAG